MIPSNWNSNEEIDEFDIELKVIIRTWKLGKKLLDNFKCCFFPFRCSSSCWQQLWKVGWVPDAAAAELAAAQEALCTVDEDSKNRSCSLSPLSLSICLSLSLCFSLRPLFTLYPSGFPDVYVLQPTLAIRNAHLIDWSLTVVKRGDATGESTSTLLFALLRPPRPHTRTHWHTEAHTHTRAATRDLHTYTHNLIPATPSAKALLHKGRETGSQGERKGV